MDGWQLGLSTQWKAPRATNIPHTHGNLRLASSAQPDRSINHGLISGNPSISQVMVFNVTFDHRCQVLITPAGHVPCNESSLPLYPAMLKLS